MKLHREVIAERFSLPSARSACWVSWLLAYYARKFGLVSPNYFRGLCISVLVAIGPGMVVGYYLAEKGSPSPHRRHSSSGNEPAKST